MFKVKHLPAWVVAAGMLATAPIAKADVFNILQNSASCSSGLNCNNSNSVIATITATNNGSDLNLVFHIVDTAFWFMQSGTPPIVDWNTNPAASASAALFGCHEWNAFR